MARTTIYISGPLTNGETLSDEQVIGHIDAASRIFDRLVELGYAPTLPHLTWYLHRDHGIRLPHATWIEIDKALLAKHDILFRIPGKSAGADAEVAHAKSCGIPVVYSLRDLVHECFEPFPLEPLGEK